MKREKIRFESEPIMFLVKDRRFGMDKYVFLSRDPRDDLNPRNPDEVGVELKYDLLAVAEWPDGEPRPQPQLGHDPQNRKAYRVFKSPGELNREGFELVQSGTPIVVPSWADYRKDYYPVPEEFAKSMTQDEWFEYLEQADAAAKIRRKLKRDNDDPKPGSSRDDIAEWVAKQHMGVDGSVQRIWYLPSGSPANEIRLLEVSDRVLPDGGPVEPLKFGLEILDKQLMLSVADVTSNQMEMIHRDPETMLPVGWEFDSGKSWSRRDLP